MFEAPPSSRREAERHARAAARAAAPMIFEPIGSLDEEEAPHPDATPEQRLAAMARLCRQAWLTTGRTMPVCPRAELPGEVFRIDHGEPRRTP